LIVPPELRVTVYKENFFAGDDTEFEGPAVINYIGQLEGWNDKVKSMIIELKSIRKFKLRGYWKEIGGGNGEMTKDTEVGITFERSVASANTVSASVEASATVSAEFAGVGASATVTATAGFEMTKEFSSST